MDKLVSAHLARRVFLFTLINMGFNSEAVYSMSGHRVNSKEINRYYSIEDSTQIECVNELDLRVDKPQKAVFSINRNENFSITEEKEGSVDLFCLLKMV